MDLFREIHIPWTECGQSQKARAAPGHGVVSESEGSSHGRKILHRVWTISEGKRPQNMRWLVFMGWVILLANEWEDYSKYFGEGVEISRNWATSHFLAFYC